MALAKLTEFHGHPAVALRAPDGARATVLLHGAHVVSWAPAGGDEQLYLSPATRYGDGQAVRGGVPVIFPQFSDRGLLPRHGLLRTRAWQFEESPPRGQHAQAVFRFTASDETKKIWPHAFEAELTVAVFKNQLDMELAIVNTGEAPIEFAAALHTYLRTNDVLKAQVEGLQGVKYQDNATLQWQEQWGDVTQIVGEVDRLYHDATGPLTLRELGRRLTINHPGFADTVVWNPGAAKAARIDDLPADGWAGFVCIEAAQVIAPVVLAAGEEWAGMQTIVFG